MEIKVLKKQLIQYIIPSMFAMLLSGFYSIIDGLFIGNSVGDAALGAINIVWPLQCIMNATAVGLGLGSAVLMSTYIGNEKEHEAYQTCGMGILLLIIMGICLPIIILVFLPQLLQFLGITGELEILCRQYIVVILLGGIFPMLGNGLNPLIRNRGKTVSATLIMSMGLITNIFLDYYLVYYLKMGLYGAGLATMIAQAVVACFSMIFLLYSQREVFHKCYFQLHWKEIKKVLHIGISPFGQALVPSLVIVFTNWKCIEYGGQDAVTVFSVVTYILATIQLLLQGIGDGVQPLFSFYFGARKGNAVQWIYKHAFLLSFVFSLLCTVVVWTQAGNLAELFGIEERLYNMCIQAIQFVALAFSTFGIARLTCSYFYATGNHKASTLLVYIEPCLLLPVCLWILSKLFGIIGVWIAYPMVQLIIGIASLCIKKYIGLEWEM